MGFLVFSILIAFIWPFANAMDSVVYNIGVINGIDSMSWHNVKHAIDEWNSNKMPLPINLNLISPSDPFATIEERFCDVVQREVIGLVIPTGISSEELTLVFSMCNRFHLPCLTTNDRFLNLSNENFFAHSVAPSNEAIGKAVSQLISSSAWNSFVLVYDKTEDLPEVSALMSVYYNDHGMKTALRVLQLPPTAERYDAFLKYTREKLKQTNLVIHSSNLGIINELLVRASQMNMTDARHSFLFTHLDLSLLDEFLGPNKQNLRCNISGIRLVQKLPLIKTDLALSIDAVQLFGHALRNMARKMMLPNAEKILCDAGDVWQDGELFNTALRTTVAPAQHTGPIQLAKSRTNSLTRANSTLIGVTRTQDGQFKQIGTWYEAENRWHFNRKYENRWKLKKQNDQLNLSGAKLRVVVYLEEPFVIRIDNPQNPNEFQYDGFCIDLLKEMAKTLNFTYEIFEVDDKSYGVQLENGQWNGVVGVLQRYEADLSVSALTISYSRVKVIDFTLPFMHLGIAILMSNKPAEEPTASGTSTLFTFLEPLSFSVWVALFGSYLTVALSMWLIARFSPYEWFDVHQIDERDRSMDNHKNQFTVFNSLWFAIGSLMQQGSDVIPRAYSTRTVAVMWWLFTLITISSYTAQLAAFLTVERMSTSVESAVDLASQQRIKFGTLKNGSTMDFFRSSKIPIYERMWSIMQATNPTVFVNSSKEGIARVLAGNYAYLMESTMIDFYKNHDCNLQTIGGLLDSKGYGIALPKGSPLRDILSKTVLQLQERTILEALKNKWWQSKSEAQNCPANAVDKYSSLKRVYGVFFVLFGSIMTSIIASIAEYFVESKQQSPRLDYTLLGKFSNWIHKRKTNNQTTMSGLRQRMQLYGAIPVQNLMLLQIQQRAAFAANLNGNVVAETPSSMSSSTSFLERERRNSSRQERTPSREETRKLSRLILPNDASLLSRRLSNAAQM